MGFVADNLEKVQRRTHLNGFLKKKKHSKVIEDQIVFYPLHVNNFLIGFFRKSYKISKFLYFFYSVSFKPHANPTVINENIKEIHILVVGVFLEFTIRLQQSFL